MTTHDIIQPARMHGTHTRSVASCERPDNERKPKAIQRYERGAPCNVSGQVARAFFLLGRGGWLRARLFPSLATPSSMMRPLQPWLLPQAGVLLYLLILLGSSGAARAAAEAASGRVVLVTGATGRSGRLLYAQLKADAGNFSEVRAFVTNRTAAREVLNCTRCDASEGVFLGDVTNYSTLVPAVQGCDTVAITVGASESAPEALRRAIEFGGVENTVVALASQLPPGAAAANLRVALVSSEGTTIAHPTAAEGGTILHWKLNAEAFLMASGVSFTIIKPCALVDGPAAARQLVAFHDDSRMLVDYEVPRADLVRVLAAALVSDDLQGLRFGFCSRRGEPTADARTLLESARYPWNSG